MSLKVFYEILNQRDTPAMFADVFSNRPAFGFNGRIFISIDTKQIYRDYGTFWELIADAGAGSGTLQTVCTNGSQTTTDITIVGSGRLFLQALSNGGVLFPNGGSGQVSQDNTNFFWDNTNKRLGINTNTPTATFDVHSADNVIQQLNGTSTNNSLLSFLNQGTGKWRIGNFYSAGNNDFYIFDVLSGTPRFYITNTGYTIIPTNIIIGSSNRSSAYGMDVYVSANLQSTLNVIGASTFLSQITGNSFVKSGGTAAQILAADGTVITAGTNITISAGTISSSGGGGSMSIGGSISGATAGSVLFAGVSGILQQDNTNFFWDDTNNRLGVGSTTLGSSLQVNGNAAIGYSASTAAPTNGLAVSGSVVLGAISSTEKLSVNGGINVTNGTVNNLMSFSTFGIFGTISNHDISFYTNNIAQVRLTTGGNFGIGTTTIGSKLQVNGNAAIGYSASTAALTNGLSVAGQSFFGNDMFTYVNGGIFFNGISTYTSGIFQQSGGTLTLQTGSTARLQITNTGVITISNLAGTGSRAVVADASGVLSAPVSDISVKQNVSSIGYGLNEICKMNPVWFDFIDEYKNYGEGRQNGNIAQEMATIIPEAVFTTPSTGKMGINYDQLHAVYIKAIQELELRVKQLENN